jgi:hypothetical protein
MELGLGAGGTRGDRGELGMELFRNQRIHLGQTG